MPTVKQIIEAALKVRKAYVKQPPRVYDKPHVPYSRAAGKDYSKQAKGFRDWTPKPSRQTVHHEKKVQEPTAVRMKTGQIAEAKQSVIHAAMVMRKRGHGQSTIDANIRKMKQELRSVIKVKK